MDGSSAEDIAHAIQLAVAPVFLLAGVGAFLNVMTIRLSRIIDRSRVLDSRRNERPQELEATEAELRLLGKRGKLIHLAIALCTTCALLVCLVIALLFLNALLGLNSATPIFAVFVAAMACLILALMLFLREIQVAISRMTFVH